MVDLGFSQEKPAFNIHSSFDDKAKSYRYTPRYLLSLYAKALSEFELRKKAIDPATNSKIEEKDIMDFNISVDFLREYRKELKELTNPRNPKSVLLTAEQRRQIKRIVKTPLPSPLPLSSAAGK